MINCFLSFGASLSQRARSDSLAPVQADGYSQELARIDSLKKILLNVSAHDTDKVNALLLLGQITMYSLPEQALVYENEGIELARKIGYKKGEAELLGDMAQSYETKGDFSLQFEAALKSLSLANEIGDTALIEYGQLQVGMAYAEAQQVEKSMSYFFPLLLKGKKLSGAVAPEWILEFIGQNYLAMQQRDSAERYFKYSMEFQKNKYGSVPWPQTYFDLASIALLKSDLMSAISLYHKMIQICGVKQDSIKAFNGLAQIHYKLRNLDSALYYADMGFASSRLSKNYREALNSSSILVDIYKTKSLNDSIIKYQGFLIAFRDSLYSPEKIHKLNQIISDKTINEFEIANARDELKFKLRSLGFLAFAIVSIVVSFFMWRNVRERKKAFRLLENKNSQIVQEKSKVETALSNLKAIQSQLIQSEKMASLGELTAGIAHEIQNPLNFVNNFSEVNTELIEELQEERKKETRDFNNEDGILNDIKDNEQKITQHGKRADAIVKSMLQHSQSSSGNKEPADINTLANEYLRLAFQGMRAKDKAFNVAIKTDFGSNIDKINIIPQDIGRVLLNLYNNAFYALNEKKKSLPDNYEPILSLSTTKNNDSVQITVKDNGNGISQNIVDKIFQPFFTTKPTGQGTGLGLSLSYDIVKAHGGEIKVNSVEGEFTEFIIGIPI